VLRHCNPVTDEESDVKDQHVILTIFKRLNGIFPENGGITFLRNLTFYQLNYAA